MASWYCLVVCSRLARLNRVLGSLGFCFRAWLYCFLAAMVSPFFSRVLARLLWASMF